MRKKITFLILSNSGAPVKQATISKAFISLLTIIMFGSVAFLGFGIYDYKNLRNKLSDTHEYTTIISDQLNEITSQRHQIQKFAEEINDLKTKLIALNEFENKIRVIANIENEETSGDQHGLFGIGGSIPEDLDTSIELTEKHNSLIREMHEKVKQLNLATINQEEGFESLIKYLNDQRNLLACTPAIRPSRGLLTSKFGRRKSPFTGLREFHKGIDLASKIGTPILATADGTVTFAGRKGLLGKMVIVDHGYGMVTRYAHVSKFLKKRGDKVKRGEKIALVGNTGRSTGPHVHYEVHLNGIPVDPLKYIFN